MAAADKNGVRVAVVAVTTRFHERRANQRGSKRSLAVGVTIPERRSSSLLPLAFWLS